MERKNTIGLCRASKVDTAQVGAHLEAYAQSKGPTTCFQACVRHAGYNTALSRIPDEISSLIGDALHEEIYYNGMIESWHKAMSCVNNTCGHRADSIRIDDDTSDEDDSDEDDSDEDDSDEDDFDEHDKSDETDSGDEDVSDESNPEDNVSSDSDETDTSHAPHQHLDTVTTFLDNIAECIDERPPNQFTQYRRVRIRKRK